MGMQADSRSPLGFVKRVNINAVGDTFIALPVGSYIPRNITVTGASRTLAASAATLGLYTGPGATGTTVVTPAVMTTLTTASVFNDRTIAAATAVLTPVFDNTNKAYGAYIRVAVADGAAATVDVYVYGDNLAP